MSAEFTHLVGRAVMDFAFCQELLDNTEAALGRANVVLSATERKLLLDSIAKMNNQAGGKGSSKPTQVPGRAW